MSKYDAERALAIYKNFAKQTNLVVEFLGTARQYENATRLEIPKLKHAPTSLTFSLEEYLNDPDFETNRRQYLAQQDAKTGKNVVSNGDSGLANDFKKAPVNGGMNNSFPEPKPAQTTATAPAPAQQASKTPAPDLIDFFDSIEQNQQPMATQLQQQAINFQQGPQYQQQQPQQTGFASPQLDFLTQNSQQPIQQPHNGAGFPHSNPYAQPPQQLQQNFTGAGFGGYTQQPQQQDAFSSMPQNTGSNLGQQQQLFSTGLQSFASQQTGQQSLPTQQTGQQPRAPQQQQFNTGQQLQTTNPFRQSMFPQVTSASIPSYSNTTPTASPQTPQSTNPFARSITGQATGQSQSSPFNPQTPGQSSPFTSQPPSQPQGTPFNSPPPQPQQSQPATQPLQLSRTGTNPFARNASQPFSQPQSQYSPAAPLVASPANSTNPFRQSTFENPQTGQGWQANQGTMGGFEQLPTVPIFPRPGQQQSQQQGAWL